jgi:hypothetical protein
VQSAGTEELTTGWVYVPVIHVEAAVVDGMSRVNAVVIVEAG